MFSRNKSKPTATKTLTIGGHDITLLRSSRRTLTLEVDARGIRVRAPKRLAEYQITAFVQSKLTWLNQQVSALPTPQPPLLLESGSRLLFQGEHHTLNIKTTRGAVTRTCAKLKHTDDHNTIGVITVPVTPSHLALSETVRRKLIRWYKQQATLVLQDEVDLILPLMDKEPVPTKAKPPSIHVRDYKRRWGSCSQDGNLSFNWRIIMAPKEVARYVVIHELAHRQEFNHSPRFWRLVAQHDPEWRSHQQWLQDHGYELYRL